MWRDDFTKWKNEHDWKQYKNRDEIDEEITKKLSSMLDEMEEKLTPTTAHKKSCLSCKKIQECSDYHDTVRQRGEHICDKHEVYDLS